MLVKAAFSTGPLDEFKTNFKKTLQELISLTVEEVQLHSSRSNETAVEPRGRRGHLALPPASEGRLAGATADHVYL